MSFLKFLLLPFSWLYGVVMSIRNGLYDRRILKSASFDVPVIAVGNLTTGGTGKTPHIEYLVRLLKDRFNVATLSRGYGRKTKGFLIVADPSDTTMVGDEPMQYHAKFPDIIVSVGEKRADAIGKLIAPPPPEGGIKTLLSGEDASSIPPSGGGGAMVVLMDDAFQHRAVKAKLNILLVEYDSIFKKNYVLPAGSMREWKIGMKRADVIIVSKSPAILVPIERKRVEKEFHLSKNQCLFFSYFKYSDIVPLKMHSTSRQSMMSTNYYFEKRFSILLVTGIANPSGISDYLRRKTDKLVTLFFPDHHEFTTSDIKKINDAFNNITNSNKIIITTEKDAMRLRKPGIIEEINSLPVFYLPIEVAFHNDDKKEFDKIVLDTVTN